MAHLKNTKSSSVIATAFVVMGLIRLPLNRYSMAQVNQLTRCRCILNRLGGMQEFVSASELRSALTGIMSEDREYTVRTLQRDIKTIEEVLTVENFRALRQEAAERNNN